MRRPPKRMFKRPEREHDVIIAAEDAGRNIILGDPDVSDLQGYNRQIRSRWWRAYREEGVENPIVVAIHKRSRLARDRGLTEGDDFTFLAVSMREAEREGWPVDVAWFNRPPLMHLLLASGEEIEGIVVQDMTPTGLIDAAHFDESERSRILSLLPATERLALSAAIQQPWLC